MSSGGFRADLRGLERLKAALGQKHHVQVGIFQGKTGRKEKGAATNAYIGLVHEMGSKTKPNRPPQRSWLRMPIDHERKAIVALAQEQMLSFVASGQTNMAKFWKRVGVACEAAIQRAFATKGFGSWRPLKYRKGDPLVDKGELRRSVSSRVVSA